MEVYLWTVVLITVYAIVCYWLPKGINKRKWFILLVSIHLIIIQGMRSISVGGDLFRYENQYYLSTRVPLDVYFEGRFEIGYQIITFLSASIGIPFQGFIFMISFFVFTILGVFIYKYSESPWMSYMLYMLLGLFDFGFSGLRQIIAMSIILLSFSSIIQKKWKRFLIMVMTATLFHEISIIFIVIYPLTNWKKLNKLYEYFYFPLVGVVLLFGSEFSKLAASLFNEDYLSVISVGNGIGTTSIIIFVIFIIVFFSKYYIKELKYSDFYNTLSIIISVSLLIQLMSSYSYYFTRTNLFMFQFIIIIIPYLYKKWRNILTNNNKYSIFLINLSFYTPFVIIFFFYYQNLLTYNPHMIIPHQFFWQ